MRTLAIILSLVLTAIFAAPAQAATYWIEYPFTKDSIPVYTAGMPAGTQTAVQRWEADSRLSMWQVFSKPGSGIRVEWGEHLRGTGYGGEVSSRFVWSSNQWEIADCVVYVNPYVKGAGKPYGKWYEAIVSHEAGHCLGHYRHNDQASSIMRPHLSKSETLAGYNYRPTFNDRLKVHDGLATN